MITRVIARRWVPGVTHDAYLRAVREGRRDELLGDPTELSRAEYQSLRALVAALGAPPPEVLGPVGPDEADAIRDRIAQFDREWAEALPCDDAGELLPPAPLPLSPMARRQFKPRRKPGTPKGPRKRQGRSASRKAQPPGAHGCTDRPMLFIASDELSEARQVS